MMRLLADEHIPSALVTGLRQLMAEIDIETVNDAGLNGTLDAELLEWAAEHGRVMVTMDQKTMPGFAALRIDVGKPMPGVIVLHGGHTLRHLLEELELLTTCLSEDDIQNQVMRIPLT